MHMRNIRHSRKRPKQRAHRVQLPTIQQSFAAPRPKAPVYLGVGYEIQWGDRIVMRYAVRRTGREV